MKWMIVFFFTLSLVSSDAKEPVIIRNDSIPFFQNSKLPDKNKIHSLNYTVAGLYGLSMTWLYSQWYKDYPKSSFHFFNDNNEWEQMDKYAHGWDAYNIAKPLMHCYQWAGYNHTKSLFYGSAIAFLFQTTVEVFDGFSSEWGFSGGDMLANAGGTILFAGQEYYWKEQRIVLKYSFHQSEFSKYRPQLLGNSLPENILKDYNGLTFWLTINPKSFLKTSFLPNWFSLAFGFGADGMTGGKSNPLVVDDKVLPIIYR
jgi:hypothetical protein